jgi:cytochrome c oxidase cbb3-type subunit I
MTVLDLLAPRKAPAGEFLDDDFRLTGLVYAYIASAVAWLVFGTLVGLYLGLRLAWPELGVAPFLSFGRLRPIHTNVVFWGWSSLGMLGVAHYVVPRTSNRGLHSHTLSWLSLGMVNVAVLAGVILLLNGVNNGAQEYREFIWPVMGLFGMASVLTAYNFIRTVARRKTRDIYLSNWWIVAALLMGFVLVLVSYLPWYQHGIGETVIQGYYMHMGVGQWFTPMVVGLTYYSLPKLLNKPIYSYSLGILAFWTQIVFYTMIGAHHFIWGPIPWSLQTTAILFSGAMFIPVIASTSNFLLTMRGSRWSVAHSYALPFILVGVVYYFLASGQGTFEAFRSLSSQWHFTNFTIAHAHLTMYGFVAFLIWGSIYGLLPRMTGNEPPHPWVGAHFWLAFIGLAIYGGSLMVGGVQQGAAWLAGKPFIDSVTLMHPFWLWRAIGGSLMFLAHIVFAYNVWRMRPDAQTVARRELALAEPAGALP